MASMPRGLCVLLSIRRKPAFAWGIETLTLCSTGSLLSSMLHQAQIKRAAFEQRSYMHAHTSCCLEYVHCFMSLEPDTLFINVASCRFSNTTLLPTVLFIGMLAASSAHVDDLSTVFLTDTTRCISWTDDSQSITPHRCKRR